jgi:mannose-6-phosphate isomerase-like protein (cupin superfamily)
MRPSIPADIKSLAPREGSSARIRVRSTTRLQARRTPRSHQLDEEQHDFFFLPPCRVPNDALSGEKGGLGRLYCYYSVVADGRRFGVHEAEIEETREGRVVRNDGWFILNLREMAWETVPGFGSWCSFDSPNKDPDEPGIGVHVHVLMPGEPNGYYHAEAAQEGFLVLSGECTAVVEGQERVMRQWDYLHSPPGTAHITVGAGTGPCAILMFGSPDPSRKVEWIADQVAARYEASVSRTTGCAREAYEDAPPAAPVGAPPPFNRSA